MRLERKGHLTPLADDILVVSPLPFASGSLERHDSAHWMLPQCHPPPRRVPPCSSVSSDVRGSRDPDVLTVASPALWGLPDPS